MEKSDNFGWIVMLKVKMLDFKILMCSCIFNCEVRKEVMLLCIVWEFLLEYFEEIGQVWLFGVVVFNFFKEQESLGIQLELDFLGVKGSVNEINGIDYF